MEKYFRENATEVIIGLFTCRSCTESMSRMFEATSPRNVTLLSKDMIKNLYHDAFNDDAEYLVEHGEVDPREQR